MFFNSVEFALFLPIVFILYWFFFNRNLTLQNLFLVLASYVFYGWWNWRFLLLIAFTSLSGYSSGILIHKYRDIPGNAKFINVLNIVVNLSVLGIFKYYDFFVQEFANAFLGGRSDGLLIKLILPVGISFYTFQALSYSIEIFRGKIKPTKDMVAFFAYISFFPQLVAGPIERASNLLPQFLAWRKFNYDEAVDGCRQILWGLFKKMVVADNCATYVNTVYESYQVDSGSTLLLAAVLFAFQIYGDFSGYSDIAIGTARLFGFHLMRNFNYPYFSRDLAEFWRRWHISLTTWFRDYVYIPMGGSRCSKAKVIRNTMVIFLISGIWHGANWTFIFWGVFHAFLFLPLILNNKNRTYTGTVAEGSFLPNTKESLQILFTFLIVVVGWIFFRAPTIEDAFSYIREMVAADLFLAPVLYVGVKKTGLFVLIMVFVEWLQRRNLHGLDLSRVKTKKMRWPAYYLVIGVILEFGANAQSFIYFQF